MKLNPYLHEKPYAFVLLNENEPIPAEAICVFKEKESLTLIIEDSIAIHNGYSVAFKAAWIILTAETSLNDLGITAKFSKILSDAGISCNVFAPIHHNHIFVPYEKGNEVFNLLQEIAV